jgi:putative ABC transport system permease protein
MFWRIIRRLLSANRGRLFVMLLALGAGAAVTAALLNLQVDAKRRITTEFRAFGPNIIVVPRELSGQVVSNIMEQELLDRIPGLYEGTSVKKIGVIYVIVSAYPRDYSLRGGLVPSPSAVLVGTYVPDSHEAPAASDSTGSGRPIDKSRVSVCKMGPRVAAQLHVQQGAVLNLRNGSVTESCYVLADQGYGSDEDHVFTDLETGQYLAGVPNKVSQIQLIFSGTPQQINRFIATLQKDIPEAEVRPIRQFTEGEARIYNRISGLLTATVGIVLLLTALCVMAAMTNVAMERRMDVGLMKAIGGATRRVVRLFLAEAALLGLAGGLLGAAAGIFLSIGLGKAVFGVAARPRLIVYPLTVALTVIVAILSAYPLRRLANIRPASVFRGEA